MNKTNERAQSKRLPVKGKINIAYIFTIIIAIIITGISIISIIYKDTIYPSDELIKAFYPTDIFNIALVLPLIIIFLILSTKEKLVGLLTLPGLLFYIVYTYINNLLMTPFNVMFLPYLVIVALSIYTTIGIVSTIDRDSVHQRLFDNAPARFPAGVLITLAVFVAGRQVALIIDALMKDANPDVFETVLWINDFIVMVPAMLIGGLYLWLKKPLGYVAGGGLLFSYGLLSLGLFPVMIYQSMFDNKPIEWDGIIVVGVMVLLCFIPYVLMARGMVKSNL
jgi:hypothetical protein